MLKPGSQLEAYWSSMLSDKKLTCGLILVGVIVVVGTAMHFVGLEQKYVWFDESATFRVVACVDEQKIKGKILSQGQVLDLLRLDRHNSGIKESLAYNRSNYSDQLPLYFVLLKPYAWLFGDTIGSLRAFSALWSVFIPPLFYWLVLELTGSRRTALIGIAVISVSPFCMLYAAEARNYTLWLVPVLASYIALWRLASRKTLAQALCTGSLMAVAVSCHLATLLLMPGQLLFLLYQRVKLATIALTFSFPALAVMGCLIYKGDYQKVLGQVTTKSWASIPIDQRYWFDLVEALLSRVFIDNGQDKEGIFAVAVLVMLFAAGCFFVKGMTASKRAFVLAMFSSALILVSMDAAMGGMRATVSRYQAVPIIAVYLAATLVIEFLVSQQRKLLKVCGAFLFTLVIGCGLWSEWRIADTKELWNHWQPVDVQKILPLLASSKHPLLLCSYSEVQLAMAHFVPAHTRLTMLKKWQAAIPAETDLVVFCGPKNKRADKLFEELKLSLPNVRIVR